MGRLTPANYSVSHSELDVFKTCKRRWMLQYWMKLRRISEPRMVARDTGILVHSALHQFYQLGGLTNELAYDRMISFLDLARDEDLLKVDDAGRKDVMEIHGVSMIVVKGYVDWLAETGADTLYKYEASEVELRAAGPIEGTEIMGFLDLAGTHVQSGDMFVMDTKVTINIDDMVKSLALNEQGPMYAILSKANDPDPNRGFRVVWNMIKRTKQSARAKGPFYQRYELAINEDQLMQFYMQLEGQISELLRLESRLNNGEHHALAAYPSPSKDCSWKCPYVTVCGQMNDPRTDANWTINQYYTTPVQREAAKLVDEQTQRQRERAISEEEV